jgi:hypothetical protein
MKNVLLATLTAGALALAAGPVGAQTGYGGGANAPGATQSTAPLNMSGLRPVDTKDMNVTYNGLSIDQLKDASITNPNGDKVGSVDKILADKDNKIAAVTADAGGFLGIGAKEVVIPMDKLQYDAGKKQFVTSLSKDDVKSMPEWKK